MIHTTVLYIQPLAQLKTFQNESFSIRVLNIYSRKERLYFFPILFP